MMSKIRQLFIFALLVSPALAQNFSYNGQCAKGGQLVVTQGLANSATQPIGGSNFIGGSVVGSFPGCTVQVFLTGTTTPALLFANPTGSQLLSNPFTANGDGSFLFFAASGGYDVVLSGGGLPQSVTLTAIQLGGGGGGGGSSFYQTIQLNGLAQTQQGILNLIPGTNQSISCVNNSLAGSTDCTFASTGGGVTSFNGRTGAVAPVLTDYQGMQQVGTGTMWIQKTSGGTLLLGESVSNGHTWIQLYPDANGAIGIWLQDSDINQLVALHSVGGGSTGITASPGWQWNSQSGLPAGSSWSLNSTDMWLQIPGVTSTASIALRINATAGTWNIPLNLTAGLQISGNAGLTTQCLLGGGVGWGACTSGAVGSVSGTVNQIVNTGSSSAVVLALASPLSPPGNVLINQFSNGSDALTLTANTITSPTGTLIKCRNASLSTLCSVDVSGNASFQTTATVGAGAGYQGFGQGTDNSTGCFAAMTVNGVCLEAPATVSAPYAILLPGTGPSVASVMTFGALSSSISIGSMSALTGNGVDVVSADTTLTAAANNTLPVLDGSGNLKSSGVLISTVNPNCNSATLAVVPVCGSVNSTGLTANLSSTNIISGTVAAGQYQLAVYMNGVTSCATPGPGQFAAKIAYTDSNGAVTRTAGTLTFSASLPAQQPAVITFWLQSSTSTLNVSGTYTACTTGTFALDAHYVLTRLQ